MPIGKKWVGQFHGTNTGNAYVRLSGADENLSGTLRLNDSTLGILIYDLSDSFDGNELKFSGLQTGDGIQAAQIRISGAAYIQQNGDLHGEWETTIGNAGTLFLFPHDVPRVENNDDASPRQIHFARHEFGPIEIERADVLALAKELQKSCPKSRVIVTTLDGTQQSRFLEDFEPHVAKSNRTDYLRLYIKEPEADGFERSIIVEFGQSVNVAIAQSTSESWALGEREKLKQHIRRYERFYASKYGNTINGLMLLVTLIALPSLNIWGRIILMAAVVALAQSVSLLHRQFVQHAKVFIGVSIR